MKLDRLSAADASNVVLDARDQVNVFLMAATLGVCGFVAPDGAIDLHGLRTGLADRIADDTSAELLRLSRRVRAHGRSLVWEPCSPDLTWHVRQVDPVDGRDGLAQLCARLMTVPMPLDRPLWELLIVPARDPAVVLRVHHALADGYAAIRLLQRLFDAPPRSPGPASPARAEEQPRRARWRTVLAGVARVTALFRAAVPPTVLLGPIGSDREVAFADIELGPLARAAKAAGATVNDALLSAVTVAVEAALHAGGHPALPVVPASVPVALPRRGTSGNAVGVMLVPLPVGQADAAARLARISARTRAAKADARSQGTFELTRTRWGSRAFAWLARRQRFIAVFVTNVRGPDRPLRLAGAPLERVWPVAPIQGNVRFGVTAMSYAGRLSVTVHSGSHTISADVAGRALQAELNHIAHPGPATPPSGGNEWRP